MSKTNLELRVQSLFKTLKLSMSSAEPIWTTKDSIYDDDYRTAALAMSWSVKYNELTYALVEVPKGSAVIGAGHALTKMDNLAWAIVKDYQPPEDRYQKHGDPVTSGFDTAYKDAIIVANADGTPVTEETARAIMQALSEKDSRSQWTPEERIAFYER